MNLGQFIREQRKGKGLTLREAAKRSGVSHPYLSQLENGKNDKPSPDILRKLATVLDLSNKELMLVAGYISEEEAKEISEIENDLKEIDQWVKNQEIELTKFDNDLLNLVRKNEPVYYNGKQLSEGDRQKIINVLEAILPEYH